MSQRRTLIATAIGLLTLGSLVGGGAWIWSRVPTGPPNIILVTVDTLRADHLPFYGYHRDTAPFLTSLAAEGVVVEQASSSSSWTAPAMASMLTGLYPKQHGVTDTANDDGKGGYKEPAIHPDVTTLAERLKDLGYGTYAVVTNMHVSEELGHKQGFDEFQQHGWGSGKPVHDGVAAIAEKVRGTRPYFLWVHLFDPHMPYDAIEPWAMEFDKESGARFPAIASQSDEVRAARLKKWAGFDLEDIPELPKPGANPIPVETLRTLYDSEIRDTDDWIHRIMDLVDPDRDAVMMFTADHGEEFRDHGRLGHRTSLMTEVTRVPMMIHAPGRIERGFRLAGPTSLVDVLPTLLEAAGGELPPGLPGTSLWGAARDGVQLPPRDILLEVHNKRGYTRAMIRYPKKLVEGHDGQLRLVDLAEDPRETQNLATARPNEAAELREAMRLAFEALPDAPKMEISATTETVDLLKHLGYVDETEPTPP